MGTHLGLRQAENKSKAFKLIVVQPSQWDLVTSSPSHQQCNRKYPNILDFFVICQDYDSADLAEM